MTTKKYALITGATSGFGYEFSKLFARDGYNLILVARLEERLNTVKGEIQAMHPDVDIRTIAADLFEENAPEEIFNETEGQGLEVQVLINDAGQGEHGKFLEYDLSRDIDIIQLNVVSLVSLTKLFLRKMVQRNEGRILQVASLVSKYPTPLMATYGATKAFVYSFTEALINELKDTDVTMTALLPGAADTDFFHKSGGTESVIYRESELSDPAEVARDGYEALMKGESRVISGFKNKMQGIMSNIITDDQAAANMRKQMEHSDKEDGRKGITHGPSKAEREYLSNGAPMKAKTFS